MKKKRLTIGHITAHVYEDTISIDLLRSINQAAKDVDINLVHIVGGRYAPVEKRHEESVENERTFITDPNLINNHNFDGLIIWGTSLSRFFPFSEIPELLHSFKDLPVINIAGVVDGIPSILIDNYHGIKLILSHLIEHHGFTKIGFIRGTPGHYYFDVRYQAYCDVLKEYNIPFNPDLIPPANNLIFTSGRKAGEYFFYERDLQPQKDIEAIVGASDMFITGLMEVLQEKGYSVPKDIAVTGFNNKTESRAMVPALTTVDPFFSKHGYTAVEKLCTLIQGGEVAPINYVPVDLVIRQSCGCFNQLVDNAQTVSKGTCSINSKSGIDSIENRKEDIFNDIISELNNYNYHFNSNELKKLFSLFIDDIFKTSSKAFIRYFEQYISQKHTLPKDMFFLHDVISFIRRFLFPYLNRSLHLPHCEDLLLQARIMINLSMSCSMEAMGFDFSRRQSDIVTLGYQLNSSFDIKKLSEALKGILNDLEIQGCYLFISPKKKGNNIKVNQFICFEKDENYHIVENYSSTDSILDHVPPSEKRISLVIKPLIFQDTSLGIIVFKTEKEIDISLLETLRGTISVALQGAIIIDERKRIQDERDRLYKEAVKANEAKSNFLANISHEIRTPLNAILGLNFLMDKTNVDDTQREYIHKTQYSAQILLNNINDIMDFSKIETGKLTFESAPFNLFDTLNNLTEIMKIKSQEKGLQLTISFTETIPDTLTGDQFRLEQILMNLINNAIKFTEKGEIKIRVSLVSISENSAEIKFSVKDTGIGLSEKQKRKLFKPFVQADTSTTRKFGGTGLGLSICRSLVELLGGEIGFESEVNRGSTFFFTLNFKLEKDEYSGFTERDSVNLEDGIHNDDIAQIRDKNILIVEDNKINQLVAEELLNRINANIIVAENGQEAVNYLAENNNTVNLIFMDLQMPVLDGFNATLTIRKMPRYKNIPIIALTADVTPESRSRIYNVGMTDYLLKPFDPESLYKKVYQWIDIK